MPRIKKVEKIPQWTECLECKALYISPLRKNLIPRMRGAFDCPFCEVRHLQARFRRLNQKLQERGL